MMTDQKKEKIYRARCKSYDVYGRGIVHFNRSQIPVEGLMVGEVANFTLKHTKDETIGILKSIDEPSKDRVTSCCPYVDRCGGCQLLHMSYPAQLQFKYQKIKDLVGEFGKVTPVLGMEAWENYRTKVHATFAKGPKGKIIAGTYEAKSHRVVNIDNCLIQDKRANAIIKTMKKLMQTQHIEPFDEDRGRGVIRHVLIRTGLKTGEVMVVIVTGSKVFPGKQTYIKALLKAHPEITTLVININSKKTSMILGDKEEVVYGPGIILDELCGVKFKISPKSFYQVNPVQTEVLYKTAIEYAGLTKEDTVIDAYCGIGTISLIAAPAVKEVVGVELNADAVANAKQNAKLNQVDNARFICDDAGKFMTNLVAKEQYDPEHTVVFTDPPRSGCSEAFLKALVTLGANRVVYVSCGPESLKRDLKWLKGKGYKAEKITPVDMFVNAHHCESICLLKKIK